MALGLIIISADGAADIADTALAAATPVVYVHHRPAGSPAALVAADNTAAVRKAIGHLHEHGHERIDFLAGPRDDGPVATRATAWRSRTRGRLLRCDYSRAAAADRAGLAIPRRLAVISLDGCPDAEFTVPALTATQQPLEAMARRAVRQLLGEPDTPEPLTAHLVTRRSCGCARPPWLVGR